MATVTANNTAKPQRRWYQFSVKELLVGTALVAVALGMAWQGWIVPTQRQRAAVRRMCEMGGTVRYWMDTRDGEIGAIARLFQWLPRELFDDVRFVDLGGSQVSDAELIHLGGFKSLEALYLHDANVTDAGLTNLSRLTTLRRLALDNTRVTSSGVADLQRALPDCEISLGP